LCTFWTTTTKFSVISALVWSHECIFLILLKWVTYKYDVYPYISVLYDISPEKFRPQMCWTTDTITNYKRNITFISILDFFSVNIYFSKIQSIFIVCMHKNFESHIKFFETCLQTVWANNIWIDIINFQTDII